MSFEKKPISVGNHVPSHLRRSGPQRRRSRRGGLHREGRFLQALSRTAEDHWAQKQDGDEVRDSHQTQADVDNLPGCFERQQRAERNGDGVDVAARYRGAFAEQVDRGALAVQAPAPQTRYAEHHNTDGNDWPAPPGHGRIKRSYNKRRAALTAFPSARDDDGQSCDCAWQP